MARPGMSEETRVKVLDLYHQGLTDRQISEAVGRSIKTVQNIRYSNNLLREQVEHYKTYQDRVIELYKQGLNDCEIAREIGTISNLTVWKIRKQNNLLAHRKQGRVLDEERKGPKPKKSSEWREWQEYKDRELHCDRPRAYANPLVQVDMATGVQVFRYWEMFGPKVIG